MDASCGYAVTMTTGSAGAIRRSTAANSNPDMSGRSRSVMTRSQGRVAASASAAVGSAMWVTSNRPPLASTCVQKRANSGSSSTRSTRPREAGVPAVWSGGDASMNRESARSKCRPGGFCGAGRLRSSLSGRAAGPVSVAEAADGLDRRARVGARADLAPQSHHAVLDPLRADPERVAPGQCEQLDRAQHLALMPDERGQQPVLGRRELDRITIDDHLVGAEVHLNAAVVVDLGRGRLGRLPAPQQPLHPGDELGVAERLGEVVVGAAAQPAHLLRLQAVPGEDEDGNVAQVADPLEHRPAVHLRQADVEDHETRLVSVEGAQAFSSGVGLGHLEPAPVEHGLDAERDIGVVLDDEHLAGHRAPTGDCTGRKTLNLGPSFSTLPPFTSPPCISTSAFTIDSPRPVPGRPAIRALEPLTNASNSLAAASGGIPIPVSETSIRQVDLAHLVTTRTSPPEFENLTALLMRLSRTWSSGRRSAGISGPSPASRWIVTPALAASGWAFLTAPAGRPESERAPSSSGSPPASSLFSISRSSIRVNSRSAFRSMISRNRMPSADSPSASPRSSSMNEAIEVSGVRSSCDTTTMNCARRSSTGG